MRDYGSRSTGRSSWTLRPVNIAEITVPPSRNSVTTAVAMSIGVHAGTEFGAYVTNDLPSRRE